MLTLEVVLGILGGLAAVALLASLAMAVVGLFACLLGLRLERCERCGWPLLTSPDVVLHRCHEHRLLIVSHRWNGHRVSLHHN